LLCEFFFRHALPSLHFFDLRDLPLPFIFFLSSSLFLSRRQDRSLSIIGRLSLVFVPNEVTFLPFPFRFPFFPLWQTPPPPQRKHPFQAKNDFRGLRLTRRPPFCQSPSLPPFGSTCPGRTRRPAHLSSILTCLVFLSDLFHFHFVLSHWEAVVFRSHRVVMPHISWFSILRLHSHVAPLCPLLRAAPSPFSQMSAEPVVTGSCCLVTESFFELPLHPQPTRTAAPPSPDRPSPPPSPSW